MNISPLFKEILLVFSRSYSISPVLYEQGMYNLTSLVTNKSYKISHKTYEEAMELVKLIKNEPNETKQLGNIEANFMEDMIDDLYDYDYDDLPF